MIGAGIAAFPRHNPLHLRRGVLLRLSGRHDESVACLQALYAARPDEAVVGHQLAVSLRQSGRPERALALASEILAASPGHAGAWMERVEALAALGDGDAAIGACRDAMAAGAADKALRIRCGFLLRGARRFAESAELLQVLLAEWPQEARLQYQLAVSLRQSGAPGRGLELLDDLRGRRQMHGPAWLERAETLAVLEGDEAALAAVDEALEACPGDVPLRLRRGVLLRQLHRHADSAAWLEAMLAEAPDDRVRHQLAVTWRLAGETAKCQELVAAMQAQSPGHAGARQERAQIAAEAGDTDLLSRLLAEERPVLCGGGPEAERIVAAGILCRGAQALPAEAAAELLATCRDALLPLAGRLPPGLLWRTYVLSDLLGLGDSFAGFAEAVFRAPVLDRGTACQAVVTMFEGGVPGWELAAEAMLAQVQPQEREALRLQSGALALGPAEALRRRARSPGRARPEAETVLIALLLWQQGKLPVAARYLGFVQRHRPGNPGIFRQYMTALAASGQIDRARREIGAAIKAPNAGSLRWQAAFCNAFYELGDLARAREISERILRSVTGRRPSIEQHLQIMLGLGNFDDASTAMEEFRTGGTQRNVLHFNPSLHGVLHLETQLGWETPGDRTASALCSASMERIRDWVGSGGGAAASGPERVPRQIVQYWNASRPPEAVARLMQSWEAQPGYGYRRFDRSAARRYLRARLGADWDRAFLHAGSPAEESDYFRLCYLAAEGGVYADCDDWLAADPDLLRARSAGLLVHLEPLGAIGNNIILARPHHPVLAWAAAAAKCALLQRHRDNTWTKTGPGLLTRAVARALEEAEKGGTDPDIRLLSKAEIGRHVHIHTPLPYKRTRAYWNQGNLPGGLSALAALLRAQDGAELPRPVPVR